VAVAHHLARLVYRMLRYGENYVEKGIEHYEQKFRLQRIKWLRKEARSLNFQLILAQQVPRPVPGEHPTWLAPSVEGKELCIGPRLWCNYVRQSAGGSQDRHSSGALKARWRARFLWFCGESIGEARVRSLRLSRSRRLFEQ
jgi:hypothetical protein